MLTERRQAGLKGRPRIVLTEEAAIEALHLLARRLSFLRVAEHVGVKRTWLSAAYNDGRLHEMAGERAEGEIPRPSSFFGKLPEKGERLAVTGRQGPLRVRGRP